MNRKAKIKKVEFLSVGKHARLHFDLQQALNRKPLIALDSQQRGL